MHPIDLRSDTVTQPTSGMRQAMSEAQVGDDVYGEDPSVKRLEAEVARLLGKEAALFMPSGTMSNQVALLAHTRPGDEVIVGEGTHCAWYESGAGAALAGVQFQVAGTGGLFSAEELEHAVKPRLDHFPRTSLVVLENTHNRAGGRVFPQAEVERLAEAARAHGLLLHLDGARLWNAEVASGVALSALAAPFDSVSVCFSKGLGAPVGSALAGDETFIRRARRFRKMLGGGLRQSGVLAAAALYALEHHRQRLHLDHAAAIGFATELGGHPWLRVKPAVETNIVGISTGSFSAELLRDRAKAEGVLLHATGKNSLRAVTHQDVSFEEARLGAQRLLAACQELAESG